MKPWVDKKLIPIMPALGCCLIGVSFLMSQLKVNPSACDFLAGIGCAWVGMGVVGILIKRMRPAYAKQREINKRDERNMQISEKSGSIAFLVSSFSFSVLAFVFLVLDYELACVLALCAMAVHIASFFIALFCYRRKL
ncbi:MAG: DUF2178 domain-containing protein [Clostridiales Family XIII bacterium]|jgi:uncharacterized membrane protein|nr:DUF2178 domain-containing protein [Clostridiales Family XIII bacterium]